MLFEKSIHASVSGTKNIEDKNWNFLFHLFHEFVDALTKCE